MKILNKFASALGFKKDGRHVTRLYSSVGESVSSQSKSVKQRVRELEQSSTTMCACIDEVVNLVVGRGVSVQPRVGKSKNVMGVLEQNFNSMRARGDTMSFNKFQRLVCRHWLRDGEIFIVLNSDGFTAYDSDEIDQTIGSDGIKRDKHGKPESYTFGKAYYPAEQVIHLKNSVSLHQNRGISYFATVAEDIASFDRYCSAEVDAAELAASIVGTLEGEIEQEQAQKIASGIATGSGLKIFALPKDVAYKQHEASRGAITNENFIYVICRKIASGLGVGYSTIFKDYSKGAYSSLQMESNDTHKNIAALQDDFINEFLKPFYEHLVEVLITSRKLTADKDIKRAHYQPPVKAWVDQRKEVAAIKMAIDANLTTLQKELQKRGLTLEEVTADNNELQKLLKENGLIDNAKQI